MTWLIHEFYMDSLMWCQKAWPALAIYMVVLSEFVCTFLQYLKSMTFLIYVMGIRLNGPTLLQSFESVREYVYQDIMNIIAFCS